ncbi:polysaccharide biosynthesis protein [Pseudalkalibacillus caeni]|uniref:Polysaccharide biosynthesis protein n=1 Tax=Exobacillus caeni TaxID=2574798 RepID=A0A5R9F323_9BACL|nr:polysaccharide biosynthesis protein [Pseudalkalibacillus caeni]TLS35958.1 polysaccharide biosynthesis protein [Pseudalkalibacillus caeni]
MNTFIKGTLILVVAAFLGECLEFLINIVLAKELGEHGLGLYMAILPSVFLVVIIASLELPISVSKFVAEKEKKYHLNMLGHALKIAVATAVLLTILAGITFPYIPVFHNYHPAVKWLVVFLIPIISFSSLARGYFMGVQHMGKIAFANFLRKAVQLILLAFVYQAFHFETGTALLIALCTLVGSELVVFIYLMHVYFVQLHYLKRNPRAYIHGKEVRKNLLAISVPTTGLRIFHAITNAVQPFIIIFALGRAGLTETTAMEHFGMLAGVAITIGFFPAFIAHSLLIVLIPTVSEAFSSRNYKKLQSLLQHVMKLTFAYGVPSVVIFYFFAEPLTKLFFDSTAPAIYLKLLWPYFLFHFFIMPMWAFLIGMGLVKDALIHSVWSTMVSFALMVLLGSLPQFQMAGIILGMNTGVVLLMLMHYLTICKKIGVSLIGMKPIKESF